MEHISRYDTRRAERASRWPTRGRARSLGGHAVDIEPLEVEILGLDSWSHEVVVSRPHRRSRRWLLGVGGIGCLALATNAIVGAHSPAGRAERQAGAVPAAAATASPGSTTARLRLAAGPLLGEPTGLSLLALASGTVVRLDLDDAIILKRPGQESYVDLLAVAGGVVGRVGNGDDDGLRVVADDGGSVASLGPGELLGVGSVGGAWVLTGDGGRALGAVDGVGQPVRPLTTPWTRSAVPTIVRPDGVGGGLYEMPGGVFRWAPDGDGAPVRIAPGVLLDVNHGIVATRDCFPGPSCMLTVTDVRTGEGRVIAESDAAKDLEVRLSPDGRWLLRDEFSEIGVLATAPHYLERVDDGATFGLPREATATAFHPGFGARPAAWSPDGRWLFFVSGRDHVVAWDLERQVSIEIALPGFALDGPIVLASQ